MFAIPFRRRQTHVYKFRERVLIDTVSPFLAVYLGSSQRPGKATGARGRSQYGIVLITTAIHNTSHLSAGCDTRLLNSRIRMWKARDRFRTAEIRRRRLMNSDFRGQLKRTASVRTPRRWSQIKLSLYTVVVALPSPPPDSKEKFTTTFLFRSHRPL